MTTTTYFDKQPSPQKEICLQLRELIINNYYGIQEEMKWGVPTYDGGKVYITALKDHVNVGFSLAELSKEQQKLLEGTGKTMRHLKFYSTNDIRKPEILALMDSVFAKKKR